MKKGESMSARFPKKCTLCLQEYLAKEIKSKYCSNCRIRVECGCGCGQLVNRKGYKNSTGFYVSHGHRGKTYLEIYGTSTPSVGFKSGSLNVAKRSEVREKITKGLILAYKEGRKLPVDPEKILKLYPNFQQRLPNSRGELFRSSWEVQFSEFLLKNKLDYEREIVIPLLGKRKKVVDFIIDRNILIEVTAVAHKKWQEDFFRKIQLLRKSIDYNCHIMIVTSEKNCHTPNLFHKEFNIYVCDKDNENGLLKTINFCRTLIYVNMQLDNKLSIPSYKQIITPYE